MAPTGSFINEQSVTIPNLLYNLIPWVLTEDQSDRPISNLSVEMSEATDRRVVSFVLDIIYDVTRGKVKTPKRVGLVVLFKNLTGSAELVKVLKTLCRRYCFTFQTASSLMWKISYVLSTLSRQLVKLMRYDSLCFVNKKKTTSVISYHLQKTLCKNAY